MGMRIKTDLGKLAVECPMQIFRHFLWGNMGQLGIYWSALLAVLLLAAGSTSAGGKSNKGAAKSEKDGETHTGKSSPGTRGGLPALPSLDGLTHGLGLGLRKRRGVPMAVASQMTSGKKDAACTCPAKSDPVCGSDGKTYSNKCMFQCAMKKMKSQSKKTSKNSKKATKSPTLKVVKKGSCSTSEDPTTTTEDPTAIVHQTATEITNTAHETLAEHLPMMSTPKTPNLGATEEPAYIRSKH